MNNYYFVWLIFYLPCSAMDPFGQEILQNACKRMRGSISKVLERNETLNKKIKLRNARPEFNCAHNVSSEELEAFCQEAEAILLHKAHTTYEEAHQDIKGLIQKPCYWTQCFYFEIQNALALAYKKTDQ